MNNCERCDKLTDEAYELDNGEYVCKSCMERANTLAEYYYESYMEAQATGN